MRNKKRNIFIIVIVALFVIGLLLASYFFVKYNDNNKLTLKENKWIDSNKYNVIDIALINDVPMLSYNGEGLIYEYLNFVTNKYSLKFNVIPYKVDNDVDYEYKMSIVDNFTDNDIVLVKDNLVLITKDNLEYQNVNDISNLKIGIMSFDKELVSNYFLNKEIEYVDYDSYSDLKQSIMGATEKSSSSVDAIVIPKTLFTKELIENNFKISFHFNDLTKYIVLKKGSINELNSILTKSYNVWKDSNYEKSYNANLLKNYFTFKELSDLEQKKLYSKNYMYGFINYGIYNYLDNNKISGMNGIILKDFNKFSNLSITYTQYNSINKLLDDFNTFKVDFIFDIADKTKYANDVYSTIGILNKNLIIVSSNSNTDIIDGIYSLKNKEVLAIKDSYQEKYLIDNGVKVKLYNNLKDLATDFNNSSLALIDLDNYNYYKTSSFKDSKINYILETNEKYNYVVNDTEENKIFEELFDFYLNYNSINSLISSNYESIAYQNINISYLLILIIIGLLIYIVLDFSNHVKMLITNVKKSKQIHLSKEDKIKYIDQLTSLKNRAYLNSKIESWDESEVYPQSIIIIDLNNISYINDNYGREEGDKVITEAANILIQHQLQNSEIIRTDGNEFLIYLVGYNEKQIIAYLRKLTKELKGLSHGFGAASGYSIINDPIKTVDDAVNEATLEMKNNKEDIEY